MIDCRLDPRHFVEEGSHMPIEQRGRERLRAEQADHRLRLVLLAESGQKIQWAIVHRHQPVLTDDKVDAAAFDTVRHRLQCIMLLAVVRPMLRRGLDREAEIDAVIIEGEFALAGDDEQTFAAKSQILGNARKIMLVATIHIDPEQALLVETIEHVIGEFYFPIVTAGVVQKDAQSHEEPKDLKGLWFRARNERPVYADHIGATTGCRSPS